MEKINLVSFRRKAAARKKKYTTFLKGLHKRKVKNINALARKTDKQTFEEIDCRKCANCCKTMTPTWKPSEISRVAKHLGISPARFREKYLYKDEVGDWLNVETPCFLLDKNNLCSIYDIRPNDCRGFPHIQKSDFLFARSVTIENMNSCPAVFSIIEKMHSIIVEKNNA